MPIDYMGSYRNTPAQKGFGSLAAGFLSSARENIARAREEQMKQQQMAQQEDMFNRRLDAEGQRRAAGGGRVLEDVERLNKIANTIDPLGDLEADTRLQAAVLIDKQLRQPEGMNFGGSSQVLSGNPDIIKSIRSAQRTRDFTVEKGLNIQQTQVFKSLKRVAPEKTDDQIYQDMKRQGIIQ